MTDLKRALTVRAKENAIGFRPAAFKVYRETTPGGKLVQIPRFFPPGVPNPPVGDGEPMASRVQFVGSLRPHQKEALDAFPGNGVLCLPCGAGKTATALAIAASKKRRTIIIVHKEFLANQWRERIEQFCPGASVGLIQGDTWDTDGKDFVLAMIQTLCVREHEPAQFKSFGFVIVDEAHHVGAPAFSKTMFKLAIPRYTLGLTATPERKDGLTCILYWFLGPQFYTLDQVPTDLHIVRLDFNHPSFREGPILNKFGKVSMAHMVNHLVDIPERNALILQTVRDCIKRGRRILLLSDRRAHCEWFHEQLSASSSGLYLGGMTAEQHEQAAKKQVVIATFTLAYEGLDIPALDTLFLVTPHSDVKQAVGRITRTPGHKEVYDVVDNWSVFGPMFYRRNRVYHPPPPPSSSTEACLFT